MKRMFALLIIGVLGTAVVSACEKKEEAPAAKPADTAKPAAPAAKAAEPAKAEPAKPAAGGDLSTGVAECDEFMTKYMKCIDTKMPEAVRQQTKDAFKQTADAWKQAASTPEGKTALANSCKQMQETTKQATASMGCEW